MGEQREPDFSGWATKNNLECSDGRIIKAGAFKHMDKARVPLVWMHQHDDPENVLGHAILEDRAFGVYTHAYFNDTERGQHVKSAIQHGDINSLSIYANNLKERKNGNTREVFHGDIKEVSVVLAGANPGAMIETINLVHGDTVTELPNEGIIFTGLELSHSGFDPDEDKNDEEDSESEESEETEEKEEAETLPDDNEDGLQHADKDERTVADIINTMNEEQKNALAFVVAAAVADSDDEDDDNTEGGELKQADTEDNEDFLTHLNQKEGTTMGRNVFDRSGEQVEEKGATLSHAQQAELLEKARNNNMKLSDLVRSETLAHAGTYGVDNIELAFPDARAIESNPQLISRRMEWVSVVLDGVRKQPFARIKSVLADITAEEARAKGYVKGTLKKEEVIKLLRRTTNATTVYKKQKLDRDDIIDITDFDIVAWLKAEIRIMLDEEIARAILVGDGRSASHEDKIKDPEGAVDGVGIRSIANDHEMYAHKIELSANTSPASLVNEITRSRSFYRGSGNPTLFISDAALTDMLLLEDRVGRRLYDTEQALAATLRVGRIVSVDLMEEYEGLVAIIVNLADYTVGSNRGGEISFFSDFDIDFNQEKYLMETRISGGLTKPKSAIVLTRDEGTEVTGSLAPSFNGATNTITIPSTTGVDYLIDGDVVTGSVVIEEDTTVEAAAKDGYYIPAGTTRTWSFTYTSGA